MAKVFITLTGTKHYFGNDFLEKGTKIRLEKEPDNEYDKEALTLARENYKKKMNKPYISNEVDQIKTDNKWKDYKCSYAVIRKRGL